MFLAIFGIGVLMALIGGAISDAVSDAEDEAADALRDAAEASGNDAEPTSNEILDLGDELARENLQLSLYIGTEPEPWEPTEQTPTPDVDAFIQTLEDDFNVTIESRDDYEDFVAQTAADLGVEARFGTEEDNRLSGNSDDNDITPWEGDDTVFLGEGADFVLPLFSAEALGDDSIRGGSGNDWIVDGFGENTIRGDGGEDSIDGVDHSTDRGTGDFLIGGAGDDIIAGDGEDTFAGGPGGDLLRIFVPSNSAAGPAEIIEFEPDQDEIEIFMETDTPQASSDYSVEVYPGTGGFTNVEVDDRLVARIEGAFQLRDMSLAVGNYRTA